MLNMIARHYARKIAASIDAQLDEIQVEIDRTRYQYPGIGEIQLNMDRRQAELDKERADLQPRMAALI